MSKRYLIVGVTAVAAFWLYIDRVCFSTLADPIQKDLGITDDQKGYILGAFFFTYALFQIPMGSLADRFGARKVLALSIVAWSLVTAVTGFAQTFAALLAVRLMLGVTEAGAYPAAAGLIKNWARPEERGRFSSVVALGGRIGGAMAPWLTAMLGAALIGVAVVEWLYVPSPPVNPPGPDSPPLPNWRGVFVIYGLCGLVVALLFWVVVRDKPADGRAGCVGNGGELPPVADAPGSPAASTSKPERTFSQRVGLLARSRNMWLFGAVQFGVNIGWVFLITLLPTYLNDAFGVPLEQRGSMQSMVLIVGCSGMFFGGILTDGMRGWLGPRLGRTVPLGMTLGGCALALFLIPTFSSVWVVLASLGVMAFLVDLHNPTIWSFAQDVGGKNVGAALGWGNMWGNLGGALSPVLLTEIQLAAGWSAVFIVCGIAFVVAACCGLMLDATKPVDADDA